MDKIAEPSDPPQLFIEGVGTPTQTRQGYLITLYADAVPDASLDAYLRTTRLRKNGRWKDIPVSPASAVDLTNSFAKVGRFILKTFVKRVEGNRVTRAIVKDHGLAIRIEKEPADADEGAIFETVPSPSLVVRAAGPSFEYPPNVNSTPSSAVGWPNVASIFNTRTTKDMQNVEDLIRELAPYARRLFYAQPNRIFIRSLIVSETHAILVHFDRSGCEYSQPFNIHEDPKTFVRLLVGLSSTDEQLLGFDTSVQWTIKKNMKASGTVTVCGRTGEKRTYDLNFMRPIFKRDGIRGRGTTCWFAVDPDTKQHVVTKDSWRLDTRRPEYEILERAQGLDGVCQMLDNEDARGQTGDFRSTCDPETLSVRIFERIVMQAYGQSVEHFKTPLDALAVIRDAIEGHRRLVERHILHCDVSTNNILLGSRNLKVVGRRGVLTDLDMAVDLKQDMRVECSGIRVGTRLFQSIGALNSFYTARTPAHDYLDDLESFFYVLCFLLLIFYGHGGKKPLDDRAHETVRSWSEWQERESSDAKFSFIMRDAVFLDAFITRIDVSWGEPAKTLIHGFRRFMKGIILAKDRLSDPTLPPSTMSEGTPVHCCASLHKDMEAHYAIVIKLFDDAITQYQTTSLCSQGSQKAAPIPLTDGAAVKFGASSSPQSDRKPSDSAQPRSRKDSPQSVSAMTLRSRKRVLGEEDKALPRPKRRTLSRRSPSPLKHPVR